VQRGVRVYKKRITESPIDDRDVEVTVGFWVALRDALSDFPSAIVRGPVSGGFDYLPWLIRVLLWPLSRPLEILVPVKEADYVKSGKRVNTFYPALWVKSSMTFSIFLVVVTTVAFGAIHYVG